MTRSSIQKELRRERRANHLTKRLNEVRLWRSGKRMKITVPNPNTNETNKRFIRVDSYTVWGNPFERKKTPEEESQ